MKVIKNPKIIFLILIFTIGFAYFYFSDSKKNIPYEREKWINGDSKIRGRMLDDVNKKGLILGKSKDEIINSLGNPDYEDTLDDKTVFLNYYVDIGSRMYVYDMMILLDSNSKAFDIKLDD